MPEEIKSDFLILSGNTNRNGQDNQPGRGYIVSDFDGTWRDDIDPSPTVRSQETGGAENRAFLPNGRVVQMTPRALARFQSFPDWCELPDNKSLACTGIGNAVPPLLYEKIIRQLV